MLDEAQARKMVETIPDGKGQFGEVPGVGHMLHQEALCATVRILREFFAT